MTAKIKTKAARERILEKAEELFYSQGYQASGINQIIEESGVAKATFYANFPSKEDLCLAYLKTTHRREADHAMEAAAQCRTPLSRFMCLIEMLGPWMKESNYKGCAFLNMGPEVVDPKSPLRVIGRKHYEELKAFIQQVTQELIDSDKKQYGHLSAKQVAGEYMLILTGAIALSELYHDIKPMEQGVKMIKNLVK